MLKHSNSRGGVPLESKTSFQHFLYFGAIGASGVVVNMIIFIAFNKVVGMHVAMNEYIFSLRWWEFVSFRWHHLGSTISFIVANVWNFYLNKLVNFNEPRSGSGLLLFIKFFMVGLVGLGATLLTTSLVLHSDVLSLFPEYIFDGSSGLRSKLYWANLFGIAVSVPVTFVLNKKWTFGSENS